MGKPKAKKNKSQVRKRTKSVKGQKKRIPRKKTQQSRPTRVEMSIHKEETSRNHDFTDSSGLAAFDDAESDEMNGLPDEEDLALVDDETGEALGFLKGIEKTLQKDLQKSADQKRRKRKREESEQEASFEMIPRQKAKVSNVDNTGDDETETRFLLPIKTAAGLITRTEVRKKQKPPEEMEVGRETDEENSEVDVVARVDSSKTVSVEKFRIPLTAAEAVLQREMKLKARKEEIATCCDAILEDPENNVTHLKRLRSLCAEQEPDVCITIRKIAMVSLMTVFIDILPGYRIQTSANVQRGVKFSKDVKRLRTYEERLLSNYQRYLTVLENTIHGGSRTSQKVNRVLHLSNGSVIPMSAAEGLRFVAVNCMCRLLNAHPHFNFCNNILTVIVPVMNDRLMDGKLALVCCDAISQLFEQDVTGEASVEALKIITRLIKSKSYRIRREILDTFLHLQIQNVSAPEDARKDTPNKEQKRAVRRQFRRLSQREKRRQQEKVRLERELRETHAVESKEKRTKMQTEAIKLVFSTYFRVLKNAQDTRLLSSVLKGLGKFAHLINVDFLADITNILEDVASSQNVSVEDSLHCVLAAFQILSGQGEVLTFDPRQFYVRFYCLLLNSDAQNDRLITVVMECLEMLFRKKKQISTQRILAFIKRMCTVALMSQVPAAMGLLAATRSFLQAYPKSEQLLDSDAALTGIFRADIDDPDLSNASSTSLWELCLLQSHFDSRVVSYAHHVALGAPSTGKGSLPPHMAKQEISKVAQHAVCSDWKHAFPKITSLSHAKEECRVKDKPLLHPERLETNCQ